MHEKKLRKIRIYQKHCFSHIENLETLPAQLKSAVCFFLQPVQLHLVQNQQPIFQKL